MISNEYLSSLSLENTMVSFGPIMIGTSLSGSYITEQLPTVLKHLVNTLHPFLDTMLSKIFPVRYK